MRSHRKGEKIGWIGGWTGGFLWVLILAAVWMIQGNFGRGITGILIFITAMILVYLFAPWKHPATQYWKLMLPVYGAFFLSVGWAVASFDGFHKFGLWWKSLIWMIPCLIPLGTTGKRIWHVDED